MVKLTHFISILFISAWIHGSANNAINGEQLFKTKCNACHQMQQNSTGPRLFGVVDKWIAAGEESFLIEWIQNSKKLYASGKSQMAATIKSYSPIDMPVQQLTEQEIEAILIYLDDWEEPVKIEKKITVTPESENSNGDLFVFSLFITLILLLCLIQISKAFILLSRKKIRLRPTSQRHKHYFLLGVITLSLYLSRITFNHSESPLFSIKVSFNEVLFTLFLNIFLLTVVLKVTRLFSLLEK